MVALITGVVKLLVVESAEPPVAVAYHSIVEPAGGVAVNETVPAPQTSPVVIPGSAGADSTVAVTASLVAETQPLAVFTTSA